MKKSCLIAVIATLAAIAGALAAVAVYLRRREKELDEYERLLFGEDKAEPADAPLPRTPQKNNRSAEGRTRWSVPDPPRAPFLQPCTFMSGGCYIS